MYRKLEVYKRSVTLTVTIYRITSAYPRSEMFGLVSQMKRCSVSISSNIAEGYKFSKKKRDYFIQIAIGSATELRTQLEISYKLNFISEKIYLENEKGVTEIIKMLYGFMKQ